MKLGLPLGMYRYKCLYIHVVLGGWWTVLTWHGALPRSKVRHSYAIEDVAEHLEQHHEKEPHEGQRAVPPEGEEIKFRLGQMADRVKEGVSE